MSAARSTLGRMDTTISADGTRIAYETFGSGRPDVIVGGAFSTASDGVPLADALAAPGLHGVTGDRSARGSSGDTAIRTRARSGGCGSSRGCRRRPRGTSRPFVGCGARAAGGIPRRSGVASLPVGAAAGLREVAPPCRPARDAAESARRGTARRGRHDLPTAVLCGAETFPFLEVSSRALAEAMLAAQLVIVPESRGHRPDPAATARVVAEWLGAV